MTNSTSSFGEVPARGGSENRKRQAGAEAGVIAFRIVLYTEGKELRISKQDGVISGG